MAGISGAQVKRGVCQVVRLGQVDYLHTWQLQKDLLAARHEGLVPDTLLLLEHPHTYTNGLRGQDDNMLLGSEALARLDARYYRVDRGGDVTYHGPGQLVGYPILDLRQWRQDVHAYMRSLEQVIIDTLAEYGIASGRVAGCTGVWVGNEKIAALGVRISHWITCHGFALNINTDLSYFGHIIPCGLVGKGVTSMAKLLGHPPEPEEVIGRLLEHFGEEFALEVG